MSICKPKLEEKTKYIKLILPKCKSIADVLNKLKLIRTGGSYKIINRIIKENNLDTSHFYTKEDFKRLRMEGLKNVQIPLEKILVENSTYNRCHLKKRLYDTGIKKRICELCGQGEEWNGKKMSLIIDHINGIYNDNRSENLRIVCPNCNATLETHCGKNKRIKNELFCEVCNSRFCSSLKKKTCSRACWGKLTGISQRRVERPDIETLINIVKEIGYKATARKYGISDNGIRKWISGANVPLPKRFEISKEVYKTNRYNVSKEILI